MLKKLTFLLLTLLICTFALKSIASAAETASPQVPFLEQKDKRYETLSISIFSNSKMSYYIPMITKPLGETLGKDIALVYVIPAFDNLQGLERY